jgi:uncharacterized membrane protein YhaH (DUF805 family)
MFKFFGTLDRRKFLWASLLRIALFIASVFGFPFLVRAIATTTRCGIDTCGAVALVTAMAFKPLAFVVFVFSFVGICLRRARDAGVPGWIGLFIPLLLSFNYGFFLFAGAPWSFAFSSGVLRVQPPYHTLLALACIAALCVLPTRRDGPGSYNPFGYAGLAAFGLGLVIAAMGIVTVSLAAPGLMMVTQPGWSTVAPALIPVMRAVPYLMIAFAALLAWIVWRGFGHVAVMPSASLPEPARSDIPAGILAAAALLLTIFVFGSAMHTPHGALWIGLLTQLTTTILPTFLIYFCLLLTAFLVLKRRTVTSVVLFVLAMLPFAQWLHAYSTTATAQQQEAAEIAAIPTAPVVSMPATLVIETRSTPDLRAIFAIKGIERVIVRGDGGGTRMRQHDRPPERGPRPASREVTSLPDEYLLLRMGPASRFSKRGQMYGAAGGPLELRFVDQQRDDLLGVWYRTFNPRPAFPPLLTMMGWFRGANSATTDEISANVRAFLDRSLDGSGRKLAGR